MKSLSIFNKIHRRSYSQLDNWIIRVVLKLLKNSLNTYINDVGEAAGLIIELRDRECR